MSLRRKSLRDYGAIRRQQILDFVHNDIPNFPGVKVKGVYITRFPNQQLIREVFKTLLMSGRISRVSYKWQWKGHTQYYCKNPTPEVVRTFIKVPDMCPLYKRKITQGHARPHPDWPGTTDEEGIEMAKRRGGFR